MLEVLNFLEHFFKCKTSYTIVNTLVSFWRNVTNFALSAKKYKNHENYEKYLQLFVVKFC